MKSRRPLLIITIIFILGILTQSYVNVAFSLTACAALASLVLGAILFKNKTISTIFIVLFFFSLGMLLFKNAKGSDVRDIARVSRYYRGKAAFIEGVVVSDIETRDFYKTKKLSFILDVTRLKTKWGWRSKTGKILVHVFGQRHLAYGDYLRLEGKIYGAFNFKTDSRFSYKDYLFRKGIKVLMSVKKASPIEVLEKGRASRVKALALALKSKAKNIFKENLSPNEAALIQAIILGDRYEIPKHVRELFVVTGTAHILAISGLHVGIVAFLIFLFLKLVPMPRKLRPLLTIIILAFYALLTGARPSVVRATVMATIFLSSMLVEREVDLINSLCLAALLILTFNPLNLFDVGFQLSFVSVLSIISFYPLMENLLIGKRDMPRFVKRILQALSVSLAAWLGVAGLIAYYFQIVTPITILANLFVIPCISVVVALALGLLMVAAVLPFAAFAFAACLKVSLNIMVAGIFLFSHVPGASFTISFMNAIAVGIYYLFVFMIFLVLERKQHNISH